MSPLPLRVAAVMAALALLAGCGGPKADDVRRYPVRGEVVNMNPARMRVTVSHGEIPGFMDAMTMPFKVKDSTVFAVLNAGDSITASLAVTKSESWLDSIAVIWRSAQPSTLPDGTRLEHLFREGDPLPDPAFTGQDGRPFRMSSLRGKAVALTFVYTLCPLPDFCIRMSNHFASVQEAMKRFPNLSGRWHLVTVSFDPDRDTPPVLSAYAARYKADTADWTFATAPRAELEPFLSGFGLFTQSAEGGIIEHNLRTAIIDPQGRIVKVINGNEWRPDEVVGELRTLMSGR